MVEQAAIASFLSEKKLALAGASSTTNKFGNMVYKELKNKGYDLYLIHPEASEINGTICYGSLSDLPTDVGGLINVIPPAQTEKLVQEAYAARVKKVWMQQGSESAEAIQYCQEHEMAVIHGEFILMYAQPKGLHKFHHWLWGVFGKLPKGHAT